MTIAKTKSFRPTAFQTWLAGLGVHAKSAHVF